MSQWDPRELMSEKTAPRLLTFFTVAAFLLITGIVAAHHEPWRDEADPWLYVRDCGLTTIVARARYAGLPSLWFLILSPLAKLGLPYASQKVLHLLIAATAVGVFTARAPFTPLTKISFALSYYMAYEYSVIVRSYALAVLLTFIAAALFRRSAERPFLFAVTLFLLFNTNAQGFFIAGAFAALFVLRRIEEHAMNRRRIAAAFVTALGALVSWLQVRTPPDPARQGAIHAFDRQAFVESVSGAFAPKLPAAAGFIAGMLVLLVVTLAVRRSREAVFILWLPFSAFSLLYGYVYYGGLRHAGFLLILTLVALWIGAPAVDVRWRSSAAVLLNVSLAVGVLVAGLYWLADVRASFSGAEEMAQVIRANDLERYPIAAHNLTQAEALLPFLPQTKFWYIGLGEYGTYMKWDRAMERALNVPYPAAEAAARRQFQDRPWLLLFNVEMPDPPAHGFRLLYANRGFVFEKRDERYWLYAPLSWPGPPIGVVR